MSTTVVVHAAEELGDWRITAQDEQQARDHRNNEADDLVAREREVKQLIEH